MNKEHRDRSYTQKYVVPTASIIILQGAYKLLFSSFKMKKKFGFSFQIRPRPISVLSRMFVENHMQDFFSFIYMYLHLLPFEPLMNEEHDVVQKKVCQRKPFFFHNSKDLNLAVLHEKSVKWWGKRRVSFLLPISLLLFFVYMYKYLYIAKEE